MGKVQKVGYRDFVQEAARKLGVVGTVENMRDGSVQIVCEGEDVVIGKFQKAVKVKKDFIDVENVNVAKTGKAAGKFKYFEIKYGNTAEEIGDRMGAGILYMGATRDEVKASRKDIRAMHTDLKTEMKGGFNKVEGAVTAMHSDVNMRFDSLDKKYGAIGQRMEKIEDKTTALLTEIQKSTVALVAMTEKVGALIDRKLAE
jgi:acylphosphatase